MPSRELRLADPMRSRVVLIGTASYCHGLPDIPPVIGNVESLARIFRDPDLGGLGADTCHTLVDPTKDTAIRQAARWCREAEDVLLVYFSGHGLIGEDGGLLLACADTDPDMAEYTGLPIDLLRRAVQASPARTRVLVLDCCYSGRAVGTLAGAEAELLGQVEVSGTYTLASAPGDLQALYRHGERHTVFTNELVTTLRDGIPGEPSLLSVDAVYRHLRRVLRAANMPEPKQVHSDTASDLALVRNAAHVPDDPAPGATPAGDPFKHVDVLVRRAGEDARDRLTLMNAARDRSWPILARLRMACELARLTEVGIAIDVLRGLGVRGEAREVLGALREFVALLETSELWEAQFVDDWDVAGLTDDPVALWGLMTAMWLDRTEMPVKNQMAAAMELGEHGHRSQTAVVLRGMLRRRELAAADRRQIESYLKFY